MRQAIETKYAGPTNNRGSRILVRAQAGKLTHPWDHALNVEQNHLAAAKAFANKWEWGGKWYGGANAVGNGYAFCCVQERTGGCEDLDSCFVVVSP